MPAHTRTARLQSVATTLDDFNEAAPEQAAATVRPCMDVPRWVEAVVEGRPYASGEDVVRQARQVLADAPLTPAEVKAALAHHPRIGERAEGSGTEATLSRGEQAGLGLDDAVELQEQLRQANADYEARFDRVFLIRAAGRDAAEILAECRRRTDNDPEAEEQEVADQLGQIALLRLEGAIA